MSKYKKRKNNRSVLSNYSEMSIKKPHSKRSTSSTKSLKKVNPITIGNTSVQVPALQKNSKSKRAFSRKRDFLKAISKIDRIKNKMKDRDNKNPKDSKDTSKIYSPQDIAFLELSKSEMLSKYKSAIASEQKAITKLHKQLKITDNCTNPVKGCGLSPSVLCKKLNLGNY
ncbi:unnamed protein product [Moneuplotes crassus]|uniref:Uncharacterized protein n=1 Tax=Euplotes crassus TaxID=5936 RepID=A0AAD1XGB5_EUPCR|nr:unnamed protein product [Moneuplotes crassus]